MIAIVHSIYSQSVHTPALDAGLMDNDAERYCIYLIIELLCFLSTHRYAEPNQNNDWSKTFDTCYP